MKNKKPLFVAYSDIHHNLWNQFNENDKRIYVSKGVENIIFLEARDLKVPILFSGDIIHTELTVSNKLLSYILPHYKKLEHYGVTWYGISGNHDQCEINTYESRSPSYVKTFSQVYNYMNCLDFKVKVIKENKVILIGIPYITHDVGMLKHMKKSVKSIAEEYRDFKKILMLHTTLPKTRDTDGRLIQTNSIGNKEMKFMKNNFDLVLTGHIHKPMKFSKKIIQLGATNQQRKTDKECDLGYWIIYNDMSAEFVPINAPRFIELEPGESKPKGDDFYYNKVIEKNHKPVQLLETNQEFNDINNKKKIAKAYLNEVGEKDKTKRLKLISVLKDSDS